MMTMYALQGGMATSPIQCGELKRQYFETCPDMETPGVKGEGGSEGMTKLNLKLHTRVG